MFSSLFATSICISESYKSTQKDLAISLNKISTGKNYRDPKDSVCDYMRIQKIHRDRSGYIQIKNNIAVTNSMLNIAEDSGQQIINSIKRLKELVDIYSGNPNDVIVKNNAKNEFENIKTNINSIISSTKYDNKQLIIDSGGSAITKVMLDPNDFNNTLDIKFNGGDIVDTKGMLITSMSTIDDQLDRSYSYITKISGYKRSLDSQINIINSITTNNSDYESMINNVDDGKEMEKVVTSNIRLQSALSMMAQINTSRQWVLKLVQ
ncbi:MAG TPA: hypothetical protein DCS19_00600 [Flavobacterium sp.]|nr:hypothetical protein [Flavobacterium sp.]